jgi:hypothetical protein
MEEQIAHLYLDRWGMNFSETKNFNLKIEKIKIKLTEKCALIDIKEFSLFLMKFIIFIIINRYQNYVSH